MSFMATARRFTRGLVHYLDRFTDIVGNTLSLLTAAMVIITSLVVILRYGFGQGSIFLQESITYLHATVFMLCCGYALLHNSHVRVDIFYRRWQPSQQAWVNALGGVLLVLPFCAFMTYASFDFVMTSWRIGETSAEPGGIPAVFLLKSLLPVMALLLALYTCSDIARQLLLLTEPTNSEGSDS